MPFTQEQNSLFVPSVDDRIVSSVESFPSPDEKSDPSKWLENHIDDVIKKLKPGFKGTIRPSSKISPLPLAKLYSACKSFGFVHQEKTQYIAEFPAIGYRLLRNPNLLLEKDFKLNIRSYFNHEEWNVIKNSVRSIKAKANGRRIILPGRDAFIWHVLLSKIGYPNLYDPRISRLVCSYPALEGIVKDEWKLRKDDFIVDTGFMGTIPRAINEAAGLNCRYTLLSADISVLAGKGGSIFAGYGNWKGAKLLDFDKQIFPKHKGSRNLALSIESLPKYHETARMNNEGKIRQDDAPINERIKAALFTISAWYAY